MDCKHALHGRESRCNGGGFDGCACGPYTVADHRAAHRRDEAARQRSIQIARDWVASAVNEYDDSSHDSDEEWEERGLYEVSYGTGELIAVLRGRDGNVYDVRVTLRDQKGA